MPTKSVDLAHLRSIVLAGHAGAGKTTLAEQLLFRTGAISRLGRVDDGSASLDYEPEEQKRHASLSLAVASLEHEAPASRSSTPPATPISRPRWSRDLPRPTPPCSSIDASPGRAGLETAVGLGRSTGRAACFFINKSDRENADPRRPSTRCAPLRQQGRAAASRDRRRGNVRATSISSIARPGPGRATRKSRPIPAELKAEVALRRDQLLEAAAEADDDVLTKYLEGEEITEPGTRRLPAQGRP